MNRHFSKPEISLLKGRSTQEMASCNNSGAKISVLSGFAKKLNQLSKEERELAQEEIHGISKVPHEDPSQIERWLADMSDQIRQLDLPKSHAISKGIQNNPDHVLRQRIKFLRAEKYDTKLATDRMVRYFELLQRYFPEETLGRDLTLHDLQAGDLEIWKTGFLRLLQEKDCSRRPVLVFIGRLYTKVSIAALIRIFLYFMTFLSHDESIQRVGCVHIDYSLGYAHPSDPSIVKERIEYSTHSYPLFLQVSQCLPIRIVAWHHCHDHDAIQDTLQYLIHPVPSSFALRCCRHFGNHSEITSKLMTFGIHGNIAPIEKDGTINVDFHSRVLKALRQIEGTTNNMDASLTSAMQVLETNFPTMVSSDWGFLTLTQDQFKVAHPSDIPPASRTLPTSTPSTDDIRNVLRPTDIILGRGPHSRSHPGNIFYKRLLSRYRERYHRINDRYEKILLADDIMHVFHTSGARFVQLSGSTNERTTCFEVVPIEKYRSKVTHDLRNMNRMRR